RIQEMRDEVSSLTEIQKKVGTSVAELEAEKRLPLRISIAERPTPPSAPATDRKIKYGALAGVGGLGLGVLLVGMLEFLHRRVSAATDVSLGLGSNLVGTLPSLPESARRSSVQAAETGQLVPEQGALLESVDALRTTVLRAASSSTL